ncbi:hypothetical protein SAMN02745781_00100 [Vibrio gazogenes DSM 21264]|uniref:Uncharacterized protein n=1 Tax=Vibrio gazogenes DSM 21264 = NBRC 103151 TaxID=1123492 RepID=A0A1M4SM28_VIBGA|nr:hypothetical protein SAMN02745781_00100 [Vibrio gazogenes DSM 21264] [Vibrio gazogenes DSM 21264 = NBRC 103151]
MNIDAYELYYNFNDINHYKMITHFYSSLYFGCQNEWMYFTVKITTVSFVRIVITAMAVENQPEPVPLFPESHSLFRDH